MEEQETIDDLWTHLPYEDGRIGIGGLTYRFRMQKHIPFDPDKDSTEILIQDPNQRLFWGNVQTIKFLQWYFAKNQRTGECANGVYSEMSKQLIVKKLETDSIGKMLEVLLNEFSIDDLCTLGVVDALVIEKAEADMPYKEYVKAYNNRYKNYEFKISGEGENEPVRVKLRTTDGREYNGRFFSRQYVETTFEQVQESGRIKVDHATGEMFSPYGVSLSRSIILEEIDKVTIRKAIDDLIDRLSIDDVFRPI